MYSAIYTVPDDPEMRRRWNLSVPSGVSTVLPVMFVLELVGKRVMLEMGGRGDE